MKFFMRFALFLLLLAILRSPYAYADDAAKPAVIEPTLRDVRYGTHSKHKLHFWKAESDEPTPLVFFIHGGGWNGGTRIDKVLSPMLPGLLDHRISVVSIEYRFLKQAVAQGIDPPVFAPMHDAARALQFVRSKASEWNLDPIRVAVSGGSAGACTSLWLAFHDDLAEPDSEDPIARQSTRPLCAAVHRAQTTLDPKQMNEWIPNISYGSRALGITKPGPNKTYPKDFEAFLARRDEILDVIEEYSPYALVTPDDRPVYLFYTRKPGSGKKQGDLVHSANFGVKLQEHMDTVGVECELVHPGVTDARNATIEEYLIEKLTYNADSN